MVCAQLMAFGRVSQCREEGRERKRLKEELAIAKGPVLNGEAKHVKAGRDLPKGPMDHVIGGKDPPKGLRRHLNGVRKISVVREEYFEESYFD